MAIYIRGRSKTQLAFFFFFYLHIPTSTTDISFRENYIICFQCFGNLKKNRFCRSSGKQ